MSGLIVIYCLGLFLFLVVLPIFVLRLIGRACIKSVTGQTPEALMAANKFAIAKFVEQSKAQ